MYYVGFDVHSKTSFCVILDEDGATVAKCKLDNNPFSFANFLLDFDEPMKAVMEATTDAYFVKAILDELRIPACLAHPRKLRLIAESHSKTDAKDAHFLADLLRRGSVPEAYLAPAEVTQLRELTRGRQSLVKARTSFKNKVSAILRRHGCQCPVKDKFGKAGREWIEGLELPMMSAAMLHIFLVVIDMFSDYIAQCNAKLREASKHDERIRRLQEIPGIAEVFGPMIIAELGEIERFPSKRKFVAYCGLAPSVRQSAETTHYGSLRPDCNHWLRYALIEAAHSCKRSSGPYRDYYLDKLEQRDEKVATVATARRLCRLVFAMLRSGEDYQPDYNQVA
ncbi:MAG: IS110 family transposase [Armatimonadetes bacterium]|nr:IS110 family transposase [Armatimonadota bacterium]